MEASTTTNKLETKILTDIDSELEKLRPAHEEFLQLTDMRARVTGGGSKPRARAASSGSTGNSGTRAGRGSRGEQFVAAVKARPGITIPEVAAELGIENNYLYRLRNTATANGQVRVEDGKLYPVTA